MSDRRAASPGSEQNGVADLTSTFQGAGLTIPPIPMAFRDALIRWDDWHWSTLGVDRMGMYMFDRYPKEALAGSLPNHVAVSHGGHGVNSYAITYQIVLGPVALFAQVPWGGVYSDEVVAATELASALAGIARVLEAAEARAQTREDGRRMIVLSSPFRGLSLWRWFEVGDSLADDSDGLTMQATPFDAAASALKP